MEWVIVNYTSTRDVFVDGLRSGETNRLFIVREGTQKFDLGVPADYRPPGRTVIVTNTSSDDPMLVDFQPKA